jgi:hypothetical protein
MTRFLRRLIESLLLRLDSRRYDDPSGLYDRCRRCPEFGRRQCQPAVGCIYQAEAANYREVT